MTRKFKFKNMCSVSLIYIINIKTLFQRLKVVGVFSVADELGL